MGKTTGGSNSNTTYTQSPEQRAITQSAMNMYMPGGQLPSELPTFDYNTSSDLQNRARQFVAPFSTPSNQAFTATAANFGAQEPTMQAGKALTLAGAGDAGQFQGAPDGWSVDGNGNAVYQDYATGVGRYMSPFIGGVINSGLGFLDTARQRSALDTENNTVSKGSFGGTREAVRKSLADATFASQAENLISGNLQKGFEGAQGQYNQGFGQGQQALSYNQSKEAQDLARRMAAGRQLTEQGATHQQVTGRDIDALRNVGSTIEDKDQAQRDAARGSQLQDNTWGLSIAQMLQGLLPPPSSTTRTTNQTSSGAMLGQALGTGATLAASMSDERAKTDIRDADPHDALAAIRKLVPKSFRYSDEAKETASAPSGRREGFMAQDLEAVTGQPSIEGPGGYKHIDVGRHLGLVTQAIQALDDKLSRRYGRKEAA